MGIKLYLFSLARGLWCGARLMAGVEGEGGSIKESLLRYA